MRTILFTSVLLTSAALSAQSVPNGGFEDWTTTTYFSEPLPYQTTNLQAFTAGLGPNVIEVPGLSGSAAFMQTVTNGVDTIPGGMFLGNPGMGLNGGTPYSGTPDSMRLTVAYDIPAGDSAVAALIFNGGTLAFPNVAFAYFYGTDTVLHTETFDIPFFIGTPDSVMVIIVSANPQGASQIGWLAVDDITLIGATQQLPNKGFDNWTDVASEDADYWMSLNFYSALLGSTPSVTKTTDAYSGTYAISIETVVTGLGGGVDTFGVVTNGNIFGSDGPEGGQPITFQPKRFAFKYKYTPVGPDSALTLAGFTRYNIVGGQTDSLTSSPVIRLTPAAAYTHFEYFFDWTGIAQIPDTALIAFASSNVDDSTAYVGLGSVLIVDNVVLDNETAVMDLSSNQGLQFWPVPADDVLNLAITSDRVTNNGEVFLFDALGRTVLVKLISGASSNVVLDVSGLDAGMYVWHVELNGESYSGKIEVK